MPNNINRFLDRDLRLITWPKKHGNKMLALEYLVSKFEFNKPYTEKEVNDTLNAWHTFADWPLLRRGLVDAGLMNRDKNGYAYRRIK